MTTTRCDWCGDDPLYVAYHDEEWGRPVRDGRALFEIMSLEAFQAGLSWITILRKRPAFRAAFAGFDPDVVAGWGEREVQRALGDAGIVRHRAKIEATIGNARAWQRIEARDGFAAFIWAFVGGTPQINAPRSAAEVPASTPVSRALAAALKAEGVRFFGPVTAYAFMQAAGLVNDHLATCPARSPVTA